MYKLLMNGLILCAGFLIGMLATIASATPAGALWENSPNGIFIQDSANFITGATTGVQERASPADRIPEKSILVYKDRVVLDIQDAQWSTFTDTNSMDPVIDQGANAIQMVPTSASEIDVGDIISYNSEYTDGIIIHRVVLKGTDEKGTYFIAKGDNLPTSDPGRIRFNQIERVVVAIIY